MLFIGLKAKELILEQIKQFPYYQEIQTQGVQTLESLKSLMEGDVKKAVIIWDLHKLQKQYLPALMILLRKYKTLYTQTRFFLHSDVILPLQLEGTYYPTDSTIPQNKTLLLLLKEKNKNSLENLSIDLSEDSAKEMMFCLLETIFKSILKPNSNPILFNLFIVINKLIGQCINILMTYRQAFNISIEQMSDIGLIK